MAWRLDVSDAGPRALRFIALSHQDDAPGCGATDNNPRPRVSVDGTADYAPHAAGRTTFTFDPAAYTCGRVQVDVSMLDADGRGTAIVGAIVNYGRSCEPPPVTCSPASQTRMVGESAYLSAGGGTGRYAWTAPGALLTTLFGNDSIGVTHGAPGLKTVTVTSGSRSATCRVNVVAP